MPQEMRGAKGRSVAENSVVFDAITYRSRAVERRDPAADARRTGAKSRAFALCLCALSATPSVALAQSEDRDALPGTWRVPSPVAARTLVAISGAAGYGYTEPVINGRDTHHRAAGSFAIALRPTSWLSFGARFDGRFDVHSIDGVYDDGLVGEPRVNVRVAGRVAGALGLGAQFTLFAPGALAPSLIPEALSGELQAFGGYVSTDGRISLVLRAGARFDQSANSARDSERLNPSDRLSLGVNAAHAILVGAAFSARLGLIEPWAEWTWDALLTDRAPLAASPMHVTAGARLHPSGSLHVHPGLLVDVSPSARASIDPGAPLVAASPRVAVMFTLGLGFPSPIAPRPAVVAARRTAAPRPPVIVAPPPVVAVTPPVQPPREEPAGLEGVVRDPRGEPVADALVIVRRGDTVVRELRTDASGRWSLHDVEPGDYTIVVRGASGAERSAPVTARRGATRAQAELTVETVATLGAQLRGTVRAFSGDGVPATIRVVELQQTLTAAADGTFSIAVEPRTYTVEFSHEGFQQQRRRATVRAQGVVILNIDLRPAAPRRRRR
jgi:hypothetical protein